MFTLIKLNKQVYHNNVHMGKTHGIIGPDNKIWVTTNKPAAKHWKQWVKLLGMAYQLGENHAIRTNYSNTKY